MADGLTPELAEFLDISEEALNARWEETVRWLEPRYGKKPGIEPILFLVGIQSRGLGYRPKLNKKTKQDLIMEGTCCVFETLGLYKRVGIDANGHIVWERKNVLQTKLSLPEQEKLLRLAILTYFDSVRNNKHDFHQPE